MKFTRSLLIFCYGLFTIAAQSLLFREFITSFEASDISIGIFFGTWFLWVAVGAVVVYKVGALAEKLLASVEFLFLAYLPAFILQIVLIIQARHFAGIESYALLSVREIIFLSIIVNAPVSIITGLLFPVLCRWVEQCGRLAVSRVYIFEAAGSFCGGLGAAILLGRGVNSVTIFFILALIVSFASFAAQFAGRFFKQGRVQSPQTGRNPPFALITLALSFLIPPALVFCLAFNINNKAADYLRAVKWTKLLPGKSLAGSFQTPQAEYLYGVYQGQWVAMRQGSICETLGDESATGQIAAVSLCQNPEAKRILVVGTGLGLCRQFLRLPQIESVIWAHSDTEYVRKVDEYIPEEYKLADKRLKRLDGDLRELLAEKNTSFDIVILNLGEATNSALNRYYTYQFYQQVKDSLSAGGVLAVGIAGGENIMGTELINLGASTKLTLEKVFSRFVLTPGENTWFIASDSENLTGDPGTLRDRFAGIDNGSDIFPPQALLSVYLPDRADFAFQMYSKADLPGRLLVNRDSRPLANLYSLLLASKQSGAPVTRLVKLLALAGPWTFCIPVFVFVVLRFAYLMKARGRSESISGFDSVFLVFSAGLVSIGVVIVLLYLYQTHFGSLYLHIGIISSLFMVGLTGGAFLIRQLLISKYIQHKNRLELILFSLTGLHSLVLGAVALHPAEQWSHMTFAVAFILCGVCTGSYFPLAAGRLAETGSETGKVGSKLETADHIGGAAGGLLTGLVLVAVLGTKVTLFLFILVILSNVPAAVLKIYKPKTIYSTDTAALGLRKAGYVLFGAGTVLVLCSNILFAAAASLRPALPQHTVQALAGQSQFAPVKTVFDKDKREITYYKVSNDDGKTTGYIFSSEDLADEVRGFGGKMNLAVYVDSSGKLINFHIIRSNETPSYLELVESWCENLVGRNLFGKRAFADVDTVSGATVSCRAILEALEKSGRRFTSRFIQAKPAIVTADTAKKADWLAYVPDSQGIYLLGSLLLTIVVIYRGNFWSRIVVLCFNLIVGGVLLNTQFSSEQMVNMLSLQMPAWKLSGVFLLVLGIPIMLAFFGNVYCGYICPFGAVQELFSYAFGRKFRKTLSREMMRKARFIKYLVLFLLIFVFFVSRNKTALGSDPLIRIFDFQLTMRAGQLTILLIGAVALVGSVFYTRFWCRYLCPVGAFLSLFNNMVLLKRFLPPKKYGRCEFGLTGTDKMDCLYCDKCRYDKPVVVKEDLSERADSKPVRQTGWYFIISVLIIAMFVSSVSVGRFLEVMPGGFEQTLVSISAAGEPRDVDMEKIKKMIEQKRLSEKEAEFYKKVE